MKETIDEIYDFLQKQVDRYNTNGFLICVSGGLDSATTLKLAVDAVGKEKVFALITVINEITEGADINEGKLFCDQLGVQTSVINMTSFFTEFRKILPHLQQVIYLNTMARLRSVIAYGMADQYKLRIIGTTTKSEGLLQGLRHFTNAADTWVLAEFYKTEIKEMAHLIGVPQSIIDKEPNDSVKNGIKDRDLYLGYGYDVIDPLLEALENNDLAALEECREKKLLYLLAHLMKIHQHDLEFPEFRKEYIPKSI